MNATPAQSCTALGGTVVVLTGPPGAGKSTVARVLADRFMPSVHLHTDDFWHYIRRGWIAPYLPRRTGIPLHYLVLRPDEASTVRRATSRGHDALVDAAPVRDLHRQFSNLTELEPHALDTTMLTIDQTADAVLCALQQDRYLLTGNP